MNPAADNFFVPHTKDPFQRDALKVVIGGFPRSGTTWVAASLNGLKNGPISGHEEPFRYDGFSRDKNSERVVVSVSGFLVPYLKDLEAACIPIIHLVRNPVNVVNSCLQFFGGRFWTDPLEDAKYIARVWEEWTSEVAAYSKYLVRLEDLAEDISLLAYILQRNGVEVDEEELKVSAATAERRASKADPKAPLITASQLPGHTIEAAKRYGYIY